MAIPKASSTSTTGKTTMPALPKDHLELAKVMPRDHERVLPCLEEVGHIEREVEPFALDL